MTNDQESDVGTPSDAHLRVAGMALAFALGSIQGGGTLCTLDTVVNSNGRAMYRYPADSVAESVEIAHAHLAGQMGPSGLGALVYHGWAPATDGGQVDALIVELIDGTGSIIGKVTQPYRPGRQGPLAILAMLGVSLPGGIAPLGQPIPVAPLPTTAVHAMLAGMEENAMSRRMLRRFR